MNGINLIPLDRRMQRRREARVRTWIVIAPLCASLLAGLYGYLAVSWGGDGESISKRAATLAAEVDSTKQRIKRGQKRHERSRIFTATQLHQMRRHITRKRKRMSRAVEALQCGSWPICWQFQRRRRATQMFSPVLELLVQ